MTEERRSEVLGGLSRTRPHRRSAKRGKLGQQQAVTETAAAAGDTVGTAGIAEQVRTPKPVRAPKPGRAPRPGGAPKPGGARTPGGAGKTAGRRSPATPTPKHSAASASRPPREPEPAGRAAVLGTAVQAAAELADIGLSVSSRAVRRMITRLPRP